MANIYERAAIKSGDPLDAVSEASREASAIFEQYKHQKDIIEEVNKAIADAKRKSRKNKLGYGLAGSLLGTGLSALTGGAGGSIVAGLLGGIGSGVAEKYRQDRTGATDKLKELEKKYKGRSIAKDISRTTDVFEAEQDAMLQGDIISNALLGALTPFQEAKSADLSKVNPYTGGKVIPAQPFKMAPKTDSLEAIIQMMTGLDGETVEGMNLFDSPWAPYLMRLLGPSYYGAMSPKALVDPYQKPQFRNPFRGGY